MPSAKDSFQKRQSPHHGLHRVAFIVLFQQVRDDFGVRFGGEGIAVVRQDFPKPRVVLDNSVVNNGKQARIALMGVRVRARRGAVCCPTGMTDADAPVHGLLRADFFTQVGKPSVLTTRGLSF